MTYFISKMDTSIDEPYIEFSPAKCKWLFIIKRFIIAIILVVLIIGSLVFAPVVIITFTCWTWIATLIYYICVIAHYKLNNAQRLS